MTSVRIFNVKFSPNLGDGLLAECLEKALVEFGLDPVTTYSVDLAGRTHYQAGSASRKYILNVLNALPLFIRPLVLSIPLKFGLSRKWLPHYQRHLEGAQAVVIGGGNLFTDVDLNFPTKISALVHAANAKKIPIYIYGVGVGGHWSEKGLWLLKNAFKNADIRYVSVRDQNSKVNFEQFLAQYVKVKPIVVRDPGLLASRYLLSANTKPAAQKVIGLCVTNAIAVSYHSNISIGQQALVHWYAALYQALTKSGYVVKIFTNGSPEDVESAHALLNIVGANVAMDQLLLQPKDPAALVSFIATCHAIVAFRMHAIIAAYSCGVEPIALKWDVKLDSFMESIGKSEQIFSVIDDNVATVKSAIDRLNTYKENVAPELEEALAQVKTLASRLLNR